MANDEEVTSNGGGNAAQQQQTPRTQVNTTSDNGRQQQKSRNRGRNMKTIPREPREAREPKFEGKCEDLKGHVYDCTDGRQADGYTKTTEEIAEHVGRAYRFGADASCVISTLGPPVWVQPNNPPTCADQTDLAIWGKEVEAFVKRKGYLNENLCSAYSLIWGQCTEALRSKLRAKTEFETISQQFDCVELLKLIKDTVFKFSSQKYKPHALHEATRVFF
jgi:hypothetical protein